VINIISGGYEGRGRNSGIFHEENLEGRGGAEVLLVSIGSQHLL
jgi:hypothetical protein